jgi:hypothetical protein
MAVAGRRETRVRLALVVFMEYHSSSSSKHGASSGEGLLAAGHDTPRGIGLFPTAAISATVIRTSRLPNRPRCCGFGWHANMVGDPHTGVAEITVRRTPDVIQSILIRQR